MGKKVKSKDISYANLGRVAGNKPGTVMEIGVLWYKLVSSCCGNITQHVAEMKASVSQSPRGPELSLLLYKQDQN